MPSTPLTPPRLPVQTPHRIPMTPVQMSQIFELMRSSHPIPPQPLAFLVVKPWEWTGVVLTVGETMGAAPTCLSN